MVSSIVLANSACFTSVKELLYAAISSSTIPPTARTPVTGDADEAEWMVSVKRVSPVILSRAYPFSVFVIS